MTAFRVVSDFGPAGDPADEISTGVTEGSATVIDRTAPEEMTDQEWEATLDTMTTVQRQWTEATLDGAIRAADNDGTDCQ